MSEAASGAPVPTAEELVAEARARAGPATGPVVPFVANLERLLASCRRHAGLDARGIDVLRRVAVRHLRNLLAVEAHLAAAGPPDAGAAAAPPALVVTGIPRTGTTLVHNLLALDPGHRVLRLWEALRPAPPASRPPDGELVAQAEAWIEAFRALAPGLATIHPLAPEGPEECDALLQNTFASQHFEDMFAAPGYSAWLAEAPLHAEYRHYVAQLALLAGEGPPPRWALKSPSHLGHLDGLRQALPGATVVWCHRHPAEAVASYASLVHALRRAYSPGATPAEAGRHALERAAATVGRALAQRDAWGEESFADVAYPDLEARPAAAMAGLYERLGRAVPSGQARAMDAWVAEHPRSGRHHYDLGRFGLTAAEVDAAFADYLDRFGHLVRG